MTELASFLVAGCVAGSMYAIAGMGLVLTYKTSGVFNFAHGAMGMFCTYLYFGMVDTWALPKWVALVLTLVVIAPLFGALIERLLFRPLLGAPMVNKIIVTVGLFVLLQALAVKIFGSQGRHVEGLFSTRVLRLTSFLNIGVDQIGILVIALLVAAGLAAMFRFTRLGLTMLATVDNRILAGPTGVDTKFVSSAAWALGTSMAALAGILLSPLIVLDSLALSLLVIQAFSAAMLGSLQSLPLTLAGGLLLGVIESVAVRYAPSGGAWTGLKPSISFFFLLVLLVTRRRSTEVRAAETLSPPQLKLAVSRRLPSVARIAVGVVTLAAVIVVPLVSSPSWRSLIATVPVYVILYLSLVLLTGYSGQISLCQAAFMGAGAFTAARLVSDGGLPFWPAVLIAAAVAGAAGLLLSLPALRLRGLDLALLTLGFGLLVDNLIFSANSISGGVSGVHMVRPPFAHSDVAFFWLASVIAALLGVAMLNLRRGRTGRVLFAMRQSEPAARTLGISLRRYRVAAFGLSAAMAGLAGAFYASFQSVASRDSFSMMPSLLFLTIAVVGGVASVGGAVVAGVLQGLSPKLLTYFGPLEGMSGVLFGLGATLGLARQPEGIWGQTKSQIAWVVDRIRRTPSDMSGPADNAAGLPSETPADAEVELEEPVPA